MGARWETRRATAGRVQDGRGQQRPGMEDGPGVACSGPVNGRHMVVNGGEWSGVALPPVGRCRASLDSLDHGARTPKRQPFYELATLGLLGLGAGLALPDSGGGLHARMPGLALISCSFRPLQSVWPRIAAAQPIARPRPHAGRADRAFFRAAAMAEGAGTERELLWIDCGAKKQKS